MILDYSELLKPIFILNNNMTQSEKINTIIRFILFCGIILALILNNYKIALFVFIIILSTLLIFSESNSQLIQIISNSFFGKFFIITLCWSFSFQILNEIRHLAWDMGYGFDLKISNITGIITLIGSFILAILFYVIGRNII